MVKKDQDGILHMFCRSLAKLKFSSKWDAYSVSLSVIGMGLTKLKSKQDHFKFDLLEHSNTFLLSSAKELLLFRKQESQYTPIPI